ncbi:MAG: hypothetical protein KJ710_01110 [Candidatus Omnitrophica bacterium]|nr:hypothetical protein [Candidatus Omnitrophota bacterium]MBU1922849.1 hypothetical protein [Candidatus Omnitrophota bacterium]
MLVVLVILLVAAIATINIGRVSLDKTCSANAADAGSLAAASVWASAFNVLTEINKDQIKTWFDLNYYTYGQLYFEADSYINEGINYALAASAAAVASLAVASVPFLCYEIWYEGLAAAALDGTAAYLCFEASQSVAAFSITIQFMQSLTDSFYEQQWENYCDAREYMEDAYTNAYETGLNYAFSNSCISSKLSDAQNDAFSAWMDGKGPSTDGTYSWEDKLSQPHTVTATLDLPDITSYELQHTESSYSQISGLLDGLISRAQTISGVLNSTGVSLGATAALFLVTFGMSVTTYIFWCCCDIPCAYCVCCACCAAYVAWCGATIAVYQGVYLDQSYIVSVLAAFIAFVGAMSLYSLKSDNDAAFAGWAPDPDNIYSSTSCADAEDLMIVQISEVILPNDVNWPASDWTTVCSTTQQHPGTSSGIMPTSYPIINSSSRAKFDGGDVGAFEDTYDPSIVWVN